jgi:hypothetical protein
VKRLVLVLALLAAADGAPFRPHSIAPTERARVIVTTDIGGSDQDDYQSMVHCTTPQTSFRSCASTSSADSQDPAMAEDGHAGARTVSRWRDQVLRDFAERLTRTGS